jgi:hypothetical protein
VKTKSEKNKPPQLLLFLLLLTPATLLFVAIRLLQGIEEDRHLSPTLDILLLAGVFLLGTILTILVFVYALRRI